MLKTLISKFTFFFWLLFLVVTIPIYHYTTYHYLDFLKESEKEKITLTFNAVKPILALSISLHQQNQLESLLNSLFEHEDIQVIILKNNDNKEIFSKSKAIKNYIKIFEYTTSIVDPFSNEGIGKVTVFYSNKQLLRMESEIYLIVVSIFFFALIIFTITFLYIRGDLKALRMVSNALTAYADKKVITPIVHFSKSTEVSTIANITNTMLLSIDDYVEQLKIFNHELEDRVSEGIAKQQLQERMMIHQSRQAAMGEMLESIAHQWRQPLNIIGLATTNLETEFALGIMKDKSFYDKMLIIANNINYMSDTIDDFRNFLDPKKDMQTFSPKKSVRDVLSIIDAQLKSNNIIYSIESEENILVRGVENEFKQVLLVLFNNSKDAVKELLHKKIIEQGILDISLKVIKNWVIIEVKDNAGGINPEIMKDIFSPYFTTKAENNGTGIGLYIAKNIIETRMEGSISVANRDKGSCFTITLKLDRENV